MVTAIEVLDDVEAASVLAPTSATSPVAAAAVNQITLTDTTKQARLSQTAGASKTISTEEEAKAAAPDIVFSADCFHVETDDEGLGEESKHSLKKPAVKGKEEDNYKHEVEKGKARCTGTVDHRSCTDQMQHPSMSTADQGVKKRNLPRDSSSNNQVKKQRKKIDAFTNDLSDVPPQLPISKPDGSYLGVSFDKEKGKWKAEIRIDRKSYSIGYYVDAEQAAAAFAAAVFKYRGEEELAKARERNSSKPAAIDLSDVPPQSPILKSHRRPKEASKYVGVSFHKQSNKWQTRISIDGSFRYIGNYENEERAAADYAAAVFKYRGKEALAEERKRYSSGRAIDLSDVPP